MTEEGKNTERLKDTIEAFTGFKQFTPAFTGFDELAASANRMISNALLPHVEMSRQIHEMGQAWGSNLQPTIFQTVKGIASSFDAAMWSAPAEAWQRGIAEMMQPYEDMKTQIDAVNQCLRSIKGYETMVQNAAPSIDVSDYQNFTTEGQASGVGDAVEEKNQEQTRRKQDTIPDKVVTPALERQLAKLNSYTACHSILNGKELFQHHISKELAWLPLTDLGNALRMRYRYGEVVRFVPEKGKFFVWSGCVWREDTSESAVMEMARKTIDYLQVEADLLPLPTDKNGELLQRPEIALLDQPTPEQMDALEQFEARDKHIASLKKWQKQSQSRHGIEAMIWGLQRLDGIPQSLLDFDALDFLLNCPNGTLDLRTGKLHKHNPSELHTKITGARFDIDAPAPYWESFMDKVTRGNKDIQEFMKQIVGEGLAGVQIDDILPIAYGPGGNGKTVFSEILKEAVGGYASMANSDLFLSKQSEGISNDRAALVGVRFLTVSETDEGRKLNESLVKGLTGGDTQMVRFLRQEFFPMTPKLTPFMFTNHKPGVTGTDNGIWRRLKLIPWLHNFETDPEREDKKDVYSKMRAELSGILTWMYKGYRARVEAGKLVIPDVVLNDTAEYRQQSDTLGEFLEDYCVTDEEKATVTIDDLYKKYREFATSAGISDNYTLTKKGLTGKLKERSDIPFLGQDRKAGVRFWTGIRLLNDGEEPHTRNKKEEPAPEQSQPEEPPVQKPSGVPTADQIANYPDDAYQYAGEPRSYPCMKHPDGSWVPYCTEQIDGPKWFYACDGCHPEVVASKGAKYN